MKLIYTIILIFGICIYFIACSATSIVVIEEVTSPAIEFTRVSEEPTLPNPELVIEEPAIPEPELAIAPVISEPRTKTVCRNALDAARNPIKNSDGTFKQLCVTTKIRKKYQGTPVPNQKN